MPPILNTPDSSVAPILKAHEDSLTSQIPSFLKEAAPSPVTPVFNDYIKTGDPALKQKAADHLHELTSFVGSIPKAVSNGVSFLKGESTYEAPMFPKGSVSPDMLDSIQHRENIPGDPHSMQHNTNGTTDYGLMQINSSMLPFVKKKFKDSGRSFNVFDPQQNREAAQMILEDNSARFRKAVGRPPNAAELESSYHVGVTNVIKQAKENLQGKQADAYMHESILHE